MPRNAVFRDEQKFRSVCIYGPASAIVISTHFFGDNTERLILYNAGQTNRDGGENSQNQINVTFQRRQFHNLKLGSNTKGIINFNPLSSNSNNLFVERIDRSRNFSRAQVVIARWQVTI